MANETTPDVVITDGEVIDGTGRPRFTADVAVKDGRVVAVGTDVDRGAASRPHLAATAA